jgi:hypothetical protein
MNIQSQVDEFEGSESVEDCELIKNLFVDLKIVLKHLLKA